MQPSEELVEVQFIEGAEVQTIKIGGNLQEPLKGDFPLDELQLDNAFLVDILFRWEGSTHGFTPNCRLYLAGSTMNTPFQILHVKKQNLQTLLYKNDEKQLTWLAAGSNNKLSNTSMYSNDLFVFGAPEYYPYNLDGFLSF
ncbi:sensor protein evgS [Striga asiatica]|uniref:Sensor protein evgS n=1 Tax=Striga asiatica TaxID=4170 RepID=A0A5A7PB96_STRAF|nr:sensor protein evgS [Striga asiatica]